MSLHGDACNRSVDFAEFVRCELNLRCADVLFQAVQFRGPGNRNDPGLLCQQPCQCNLSRGRSFASGDLPEEVDECGVGCSCFLGKTRHRIAEVARIELSGLANGTCEETFAEWAERNETDSEFFQQRQDLRFRLAPPH